IIRKTGTVYTCFNTVNTSMPDNNIQCLTIDSMNNIWIGTATQGVVKFQDFTGIRNFSSTSDFETYPNPVTDRINFKVENLPFTVEVMDARGALVFSETINTNVGSIDVSRFKNGIYSLKAVSKDNVAVIKRFCKQ
ncbi:MAG TPA: T9SS type A sorting domain-containing protein, partial [Bacteroidia bacterium]|nr:T9SS type A sorting domain-containing protein [Bacteroidia bacterium]